MKEIKYFHTYNTYVKQRWVGKHIIDVLTFEFKTKSEEYYKEAIESGVITVNDKVVSINYKLKDCDLIKHTVHMHEPICPEIEVIKKEDEFWVVNKPAGIPCHPTGGYFEYSVTKSLFKDQTVGCVNRLDMPVSGVLIITTKNSGVAHASLKSAQKIYVAKVKGEFPEQAIVNEPIGLVGPRMHDICKDGKESTTVFKRLSYHNGYSLVECRPITGRTHQIRIHIKHLGFPILNDILYGGCETTQKAEHTYCKEKGYSEYIEDQKDENTCISGCDEDISMYEDDEKYKIIIKHCKGTNNRAFYIKDSFICLHAWKYFFCDVEYVSPWPFWAKDDDLLKKQRTDR